jgi:hypothetical protein
MEPCDVLRGSFRFLGRHVAPPDVLAGEDWLLGPLAECPDEQAQQQDRATEAGE